MNSLFAEQNNLLLELNHIEKTEREGSFPLRRTFNYWVVGFGIFLLIYDLFYYLFVVQIDLRLGLLRQILIGSVFLGISFMALYGINRNKRYSYYLMCTLALCINLYGTYLQDWKQIHLITLLDALTIFVFSNQFAKKGFYTACVFIGIKIASLFFLFSPLQAYNFIIEPIAACFLAFTVGLIPVFVKQLSQISLSIKKQEIRAQMLALQNQELAESLDAYNKGEARIKPKIIIPVNPNIDGGTEQGEYVSAYE